ncbi:MAG: serine/threonine protein kinase [Verrucomicrobiales bacterium]|nr:serine/threonine protein kinase [Verrucomicrobiales bacterium]|tara:strand:- start:1702 stop:2970 length:1269 start_codon:yes stop_codon:yes gene_type:complete
MKAPSLLLLFALSTTVQASHWPSWRGDISGSGHSSETDLPLKWTKTKNIKWRTQLPNRGNSTPVIWGDRIFVSQVIESDNFRSLMCFDRKNGKLLWQKGVKYTENESTHRTNPYCSASPVTDGKRVIVTFASAGIYCYDFNGKELWHRDLGPQKHTWGNASSPLIHKDLCIIYHGPGPDSFIIGMDKNNGSTVWQYNEPKWKIGKRTDGFAGNEDNGIVGSFSTPIIANIKGRDELIMSFPMEIKAFNPITGDELWNCRGLNPLVYTSTVYADGIVVAMGGYYGNSLAVKAGGKGDVTETHRLWHKVRHNGGIGSGIIHEGHLYYPTGSGIGICMNVKSGKEIWEERLRGSSRRTGTWSSLTQADDRIYYLNQGGDTVVFNASTKFKQLAANSLGEQANSSIVPSSGELFIRTHEALWCIAD